MAFSCEQARKWCLRAALTEKNPYQSADLLWQAMDGETPYNWKRIKEHFTVFREA